jgi:hypothetical protein
MASIVTGPLAVVTDATGKLRYYYHGTVLPPDLPAAELSRLTKVGLVGPVEVLTVPVGAVTTGPTGPALVTLTGPADVPANIDEPASVDDAAGSPPAPSAPKAEWVDYAADSGTPRDEAEAATKQELIDRHGG